ncbi:hypothetical protein GF336_05055 [Candidatus Woesearchaeota archaeon]|nr:hypothetical protein [Candidatus Woesearchaeota archaeon]
MEKKINFAIFLSRSIGQDRKSLRNWANNVFPEDWTTYFIARRPMLMEGYAKNIKVINMYEDPVYKTKVSDQDIKKEEKWLGVSFNSILYSEHLYFHIGKFKPKKKDKKKIVRHIRFFRKFLEKNKIDFCTIGYPAEVTDIVFYYVVKKMRIEYYDSFMPFTLSEDTRYVCIKDGVPLQLEDIKERKKERDDIYESIKDLLLSRNVFLSEVQNLSKLNLGFSFNTLKHKFKQLIEIIKNINPNESQFNIIEMTLIYLKEWLNSRMTKRLLEQPKQKENYFYFPLHRKRDSAITFKAPIETRDQLKLIRKISKFLPQDIKLYVKGHPHYLGSDFTRNELKCLKRLKNVRVIDYNANNMDLIRNSMGIITINSTTGYEAIVLEKPLITFGNEYYTKRKGVCIQASINKLDELKDILMKVKKYRGYGIDPEKRKDFIYEYYKCSFPLRGHVFIDIGERMNDQDFETIKDKTKKAAKLIMNN